MSVLARTLPAAALLLLASPARALDPFEIQVYDGTANAKGAAGLELHFNHVAVGLPSAPAPELPPDGQTHLTFEPSYGLTRSWELGAYFQTAMRADGHLDYAGVKLRSKFVTPPGWQPHLRLGVNFELARLPEAYDRGRWSAEIRPIAAWEDEGWILAVNPTVTFPLAGPDLHAGPQFEPLGMVKRKIREEVAVGFEYYGSVGAISAPLAWRDQEHYLFAVLDVLAIPHFELNLGAGEGLTGASNTLVAKMIVGYVFGDAEPLPKTARSPFTRWARTAR